jgi:hypothetical protein
MTETAQCGGLCRKYFDPDDLDDLGLCEACGLSYYDVGDLEDAELDDEDGFACDW